MARPAKPAAVIKSEGRSHRTKAEIKAREEAEAELDSGKKLAKRAEVKNDPIASKEFARVKKLMVKLKKDDDRFTAVLNRYCMLYSECRQYENLIRETEEEIEQLTEELAEAEFISARERAKATQGFIESKNKLLKQIAAFDGILMQKRKMMLDIEKENVMTVSSSLRAIPKNAEKKENPLLVALRDDEDEED